MHTFNPQTKAESAKVNENFTDLTTGAGDVNSNRLELFRSEVVTNFVDTGLLWSIVSGLNGTMTTGIAYITDATFLMLRLSVTAITSRTYTASKDTYVDLGSDGVIYYTEVANGATAPSLTANRIRIAKLITSGVAITSIVQGGFDRAYGLNGGLVNVDGNRIYNVSPLAPIAVPLIQPTLLNSWSNYYLVAPATEPWGLCGYWKDAMGIVHLSGLIRNGTAAVPIFVLPIGYRPRDSQIFICDAASGAVRIDVRGDNGQVMAQSYKATGTNAYVSLDNVQFFAN